MDLKYGNLVAHLSSSDEGKQAAALLDVVQQVALGREKSQAPLRPEADVPHREGLCCRARDQKVD
ncbi:hypothetical protein DIPPA_19229 [Diplonema papillatum]|nr:hypothetical protein DIPPA_19229 [Diplonema papillatum]